MINYLFSQIDEEKGLNENQLEYLSKDLKGGEKLVFIASDPEGYEKSDEKLESYLERFKKSGFVFKKSLVIDKRMDKELAKKEVKDADIIFLMGGDPYSEMEFIKEYGLVDLLKQKKFIMGVSAGAMIQAPRVVYRDEFNNDIIRDFKGLNLVDIYIFPHVDYDAILEESKEMNEIYPNTPLLNSEFVRVENGNIEIVKENTVRK